MLYSASYWRSTIIINIPRSCWQKGWSCRWPTLGFSVRLPAGSWTGCGRYWCISSDVSHVKC